MHPDTTDSPRDPDCVPPADAEADDPGGGAPEAEGEAPAALERTGSYRADEIGQIPRAPGVYQMFDARGAVIYVGKAVNLRARVRQYFALTGGDNRPSVPLIRKHLDHIEIIVTNTEMEAFILENTLIKRGRPRYNVLLRDDKTYVSIRIDPREPWPRALVIRGRKRDKAVYFGPFTNSPAVRQTLKLLQKIFPLRSCSDAVLRNRVRPCLLHAIGRCCAPCVGKVAEAEYAEHVRNTLQFLRGQTAEVVQGLQRRMAEASERLDYERAARYRDHIRAIEETRQSQRVATHTSDNRDVLGYHQEQGQAAVAILFIRDGQLIQSLNWLLPVFGEAPGEAIAHFLGQYYDEARMPPEEILLPILPADAELIGEWLSNLRGGRVRLITPERGDKVQLVEMADRNAREALARKLAGREALENALGDLARRLRLPAPPHTIECYDIATLQGTHSAGSKVCFVDGEPSKAGYRLFKIKEVEGQDDFAMMQEVLTRRFRRALESGEALPDLVVVDGGKGQLSSACQALEALGLPQVPVAALVKEHLRPDADGGTSRTLEQLFLPGRKNPVVFPPRAPSFYLLQRLRDEAHRFVNSFHGRQRRQASLHTALEEVPGIGRARAQALLRHFGSLPRVAQATPEALAAAPRMTTGAARAVFDALHPPAAAEAPRPAKDTP